MITCYLLSSLTFLLIVTAFFQSFLKFSVFQANHLTFMVLSAIVYLLTETLVIFFFVDAGMRVKESVMDHKADPRFHSRSVALKRKVFPPLMLNLLFMMTLFILVGAVDTHHFPRWAYQLLFLACLLHSVKTKWIQNRAFKESIEMMMDMSGAKRGN